MIRRALGRVPPLETALIAASLAVLVAVGVLGRHRDAPPAPASYSSYDYAGGGYRALYELMAREGVPVERFERRGVFFADENADTLLYAEPSPGDPDRIDPTLADARALETWVRDGGAFLYLGYDDAAARAGLFRLPPTRAAGKPAGHSSLDPALRADGIAALVSGAQRRWQVARRRDLHVLAADARGPLIVRYAFGRGRVTAIVDESLFTNESIASGGRARLAYVLAAPRRPGGTLAFEEAVHGHLVPEHWWAIVPRPFLIAVCIAFAAVLVAIVGAAARLGPPLAPVPQDDRSSADFIDGLASLYERGGAASSVLRDATRSAEHAVARRAGLADDATSDEIAANIDRADLRTAYAELLGAGAKPLRDDRALLRGVVLAQRIRKEYAAHGSTRY